MSRIFVFVLVLIFSSLPALAAEENRPDTLVKGDIDNGWMISTDVKFSSVFGEYANFVGLYGGWVINQKFHIGVGGYGMTNLFQNFGYGGLVTEYFFNRDDLVNFSVKNLVGGGEALGLVLFVDEPEAKVMLNVTDHFQIGFGVGYRFVRNAWILNDELSGWTTGISLRLGNF